MRGSFPTNKLKGGHVLAEEENVKEKDGFEEFASQALRLHRKGAFENLLCQHLIMSVNTDPMNKVRLVCEAAWMVEPGKISLDMNQVETIYTVALSFLNTTPKDEFIAVAWGFTLTLHNYERFIKPWRKGTALSFCAWTRYETEKKRERIKKAESEAEEFYLLTDRLNLHPSSFQMLKTEFLRWSIPLVMEVFEKLSRLVQPDLYKEMLQALSKKEALQ